MPLPRGIVGNNPGNIRKSAVQWQGQIAGNDPAFCQFASAKYGIRAIMVLLRRYYYVLDLTNIEQIISRWAPPADNNNTPAYITAVASQMRVQSDAALTICPETYISFAQAIALHENGRPPIMYPSYWYDISTYQDAYRLTLPNAQTADP